MHRFFRQLVGLSLTLALVLGLAFRSAGFQDKEKKKEADKDQAQSPIEVYEWSIWVGNPAQTTINTSRIYRNAMPNVVGTSRPKFEGKELAGKFPIAPISVVTFRGEPRRDVDVDLRAKKGAFLSHWPASKEHTGRLQWFGSDLSAQPARGHPAKLSSGDALAEEAARREGRALSQI